MLRLVRCLDAREEPTTPEVSEVPPEFRGVCGISVASFDWSVYSGDLCRHPAEIPHAGPGKNDAG